MNAASETANEFIFGPALASDAEALVSIDAGSPQPWTARAFMGELGTQPPSLFVLRSQGRAVAFVVARRQGPEMDIVNLAVAPALRRRGLGLKLLLSVIDHAASSGVETAFLEVREGNLEARALYQAVGFREFQRRSGFYRDPVEDALLLRLGMSPIDRLKAPRNAC